MAYVYGHYKADTNELFYVGKGTGNRAWDKRARNAHWRSVVKRHGLVVKLIEDGLSDEAAYDRERILIEQIGLTNLTNKTEGGVGMTSVVSKEIMNRPEVKRKTSEAARLMWQDPEFRKRRAESMQRVRNTPEYQKKHSDAMKKVAIDPVWLRENAERIKLSARKPERIEKIRESSKKLWESQKHREKISRTWAAKRVNKS